ncbi:MAG: TIGR00282 family metallophosphoesterase [Clostridia bacterium]
MKVLAIGDIVADTGVETVGKYLNSIKKEHKIDFVIANGENASALGIIPAQADALFSYGVDVITLGNHSFAKHAILNYLDDNNYILRPHNYAPQLPGRGYAIYNVNNYNVLVINLIGRVDMEVGPDNPFLCAEKILKSCDGEFDIAILDFHAQATSEKYAMGFHLDGKISALFGTHTHVKTADTRIFPNGMGYITDVGMVGPMWSVIGVTPEISLKMFRGDIQERFTTATGVQFLNATIFDIDEDTKKCRSVENLTIIGD